MLAEAEAAAPAPSLSGGALRWSATALVAVSWISAATFGAYILAFYLGALNAGRPEDWNQSLSGLYEPGRPAALAALAAHLGTGAVLLLFGPIQLIGGLRRRWPGLHRWMGRVYVAAAALAGLGGLGFILAKGTIGGPVMDIGFGLYGALMVVCAAQAYRHARAGRYETHRAWAIRLFALAIGSWLYRMDYGFWLMLAHGAGHTHDFRGPFDAVMAFFFYLPNLAVAELFIRARRAPRHAAVRLPAAVGLALAAAFVAIGTYYFTLYYWGPGILGLPVRG